MRRVLIIDDSRMVRAELQAALEPLGFEIDFASNGGGALQKLSASLWDLVFLDIQLPVMDGPTLLRMARARGLTAPVVMVTSVTSAAVISDLRRLGATRYISKPFTAAEIRATAVSMLQLPREPGESARPQVLVQHTDPNLPAEVLALLPAHVSHDSSDGLGQSLDLAEDGGYGLVLIESDELAEEVSSIAGLFRRALPGAGIFHVSAGSAPASLWAPDDALDGTLPRALDEAIVHDFLYVNFLRQLVFVEGTTVRAAGFQGDEKYLPAYFASLGRLLLLRCAPLAQSDISIDLSSVPPVIERTAELIQQLWSAFQTTGVAPSFRVSSAVRPALVANEALRGVVFL